MRSLRFLASRRWLLFALVVAALVYLAWILGQWQFDRLDDRRAHNAIVERNEGAEAVSVGSVLAAGRPVAEADEWRLVTASGTYAVDDTVIVRYRTRDGIAGVDVVVPLVTADGTSLLVDRGWLATANRGVRHVVPPSPPAGQVEVTGYVRLDAAGDSTEVSEGSTRAISSVEIGTALDRTVYGGFVELASESPGPSEPLDPVELPDLGAGPHFFYGLQWWFFGLLALGGFLFLAYDEWRGNPAGRRRGAWGRRRSESPEHAAVDREHHAGQE